MMCRTIVIVAVLMMVASCRGAEEPRPTADAGGDKRVEAVAFSNVGPDAEYVGDEACASCHEDIYQGYQEHGMARSLYRLTPDKVVEDFDDVTLYHKPTDLYYRVFADTSGYYEEEYRLGPEGRKVHSLVRKIAYVMGSGTAARTYLTEVNDRYYELPLTWYTQKKQWDFSPGYRKANPRFHRLIPDRCMACHDSYADHVPFAEGKYLKVPEGIGCERCHGPGGPHVEARLANPEPAGDVDPTIVNPAHLDLDRRLDVCQQCHLHTTVSFERERRSIYGFRPSFHLDDYLSLYAVDQPKDDSQINVISHADRMRQSRCFIETQNTPVAMDCVTCHNPHEGFRSAGDDYFNKTCKKCHDPAGYDALFTAPDARQIHTPEADCITCHMPKVEAEDAPHSSFTDHKVRVVRQETQPVIEVATSPVTLVPYFDRDKEGPEAAVYAGMAYVIYGKQQADTLTLRKGIDLLETALPEHPDAGEAHFLLGLAHLQLGEVKRAIPPLEVSIRIDPNIPERLNALAQAYEGDRRDPATIERLYRHALDVQPAVAEIRVNYGRFLVGRGRVPEAIVQYRKALQEQPWLAAAQYNLGSAYLRQDDEAAAEKALLEAVALEPDHVQALSNLGLLYAQQGKDDAALARFKQAVAAGPDDAVALGNLGAYYLNHERSDDAIPLLERAVTADPQYLDGLVNLSLAYFRQDRLEDARTYAQRALLVDPSNGRARQILGAL